MKTYLVRAENWESWNDTKFSDKDKALEFAASFTSLVLATVFEIEGDVYTEIYINCPRAIRLKIVSSRTV